MVALRFVVVTVYWVRQQTFFDGGGNNPLLLEPTKLSLKRMPVTRRLSGNEGSPSKRSISLSRAHASGAWWIATTSIMQARCFFLALMFRRKRFLPVFVFPLRLFFFCPCFLFVDYGIVLWGRSFETLPIFRLVSQSPSSISPFSLFFYSFLIWLFGFVCLAFVSIYLACITFINYFVSK